MTEENTTRTLQARIEDALGIVHGLGDGVRAACATCGEEATRTVYHLPYCHRHGEECEAGAVRTLWEEAQYAGERLQPILENLIPLWNNELADELYGGAVRKAIDTARAAVKDLHEDEVRVGLHLRAPGPVPGIERGEIERDEYGEWDTIHFRTHALMQKGFDEHAPDEVMLALEGARADAVSKLQAAHDWIYAD